MFADERLNDIVGSAYYVAPEVLHRSYSTEADVWSIGVIAYILLCGSRPFWARTESGIFRAVLKADPSFDEPPWPSLSSGARDFVRRLLNKDPRKRMTAAQALCECLIPHKKCWLFVLIFVKCYSHSLFAGHPWIKNTNDVKVPLDILILKLMKAYMRSSSLRKAALRVRLLYLFVYKIFFVCKDLFYHVRMRVKQGFSFGAVGNPVVAWLHLFHFLVYCGQIRLI